MLLIDYLEEAAEFLKEKDETLKKLEAQYKRIYDRDIKREMILVQKEIKKKKSEVGNHLLLNLDEFRYLYIYFPELLQAFMEDEHIGKFIKRKFWLLEYRPLPPKEAAKRLEFLRLSRLQLREAKKFLKKWVGSINPRAFSATFPVLKGHLKGKLEKDEVVQIIKDVDKMLIREGWLLLISDSLIKIPLTKFSNKLIKLNYQEIVLQEEMKRARGRGTVAEMNALKNYNKVQKKRTHYYNVIVQILLANPGYLRNLKKQRHWLSRKRKGVIEKIAKDVTPHTVKERAWLNEMQKKLDIEGEIELKNPKKK